MWTQFMDMHSGGGQKEKPYEYIYIEAPLGEAMLIFYNRFGHSPERVSCTCCGEDYSISEAETLEEVSAFERRADWPRGQKPIPGTGQPVDEYTKREDVLIVPASEIRQEEREGTIPYQGYVWVD